MSRGQVAIPGPLIDDKNPCLDNDLALHEESRRRVEHDFEPSDDGFGGGFD
jgi:hypothetical protein